MIFPAAHLNPISLQPNVDKRSINYIISYDKWNCLIIVITLKMSAKVATSISLNWMYWIWYLSYCPNHFWKVDEIIWDKLQITLFIMSYKAYKWIKYSNITTVSTFQWIVTLQSISSKPKSNNEIALSLSSFFCTPFLLNRNFPDWIIVPIYYSKERANGTFLKESFFNDNTNFPQRIVKGNEKRYCYFRNLYHWYNEKLKTVIAQFQ